MNTHIFIHTVTGPEHLLTFYSLWMCHLYQFFFSEIRVSISAGIRVWNFGTPGIEAQLGKGG